MSDFLDELRRLSPKQLMLLAYRQHQMLEAATKREPIAIIGMACRLPGADSPEAFWRLLESGKDAIREVPADRWERDALFDPDPDAPGRLAVREAGFIDDIAGFDAAFFGIAPREAQSMDPQQRMLLEVAWEALESAGLPPDQLSGEAAGVFVGQCNADYLQRLLWRGDAAIDGYLASGTSPSVTSGRLAYCLGLRGPAMTVDTSCSSSLVALHLACRSLRDGESKVALAAGVNLICAPEATIAMSKAHMLAPDGRSKAFDERADGLGRGEGCVVVVLKRLSDAEAAGDAILAVIRGSAVNQDGRSAGLTVPNGPAQEAVIAAALADAGVAACEVGYVEAHGTGTKLGDPIEVRALSNALRNGPSMAEKLLIGSVKSNIGHLEGAAGLTGMVKAVLCLQHGRIPPQPHFHTPSPHIAWSEIGVAVSAGGQSWPMAGSRIAGVSSFGFSGTNAHVILEQAPETAKPASEAEPKLPIQCLALSARSAAALRALARAYAALLEGGAPLGEVSRDAAVGRSHHALRLAVVADTAAATADALRAFAAGQAHPALLTDESARVSWDLPDTGGYATSPLLRDIMALANALLPALGERARSIFTGAVTPTGAVEPREDAWRALSRALGELYVRGAPVNWQALGHASRGVRLPTYPFDRQRYWVDVARPASAKPHSAPSVGGTHYEIRWRELPVAPPAAASLVSPDVFMPGIADRFTATADLAIYDRLAPLLDRLSSLHVAKALRALGFDDTPGRVFTLADEAMRLGIVARHRRLFGRMLAFLAADSLLRTENDRFEVVGRLTLEDPETLYRAVGDQFGGASGALHVLRRCGRELDRVLAGGVDPVGLLFPGGSFAEAGLLYAESPAARAYNGALAMAAQAAIAALPPGGRVRIIEIGGGTGGTTDTLLAALPADCVDYTFTDVSRLFLDRAAKRYPAITTGLLNIERDPAAQGFSSASYDMVVAANVLHATDDLNRTLRHALGLLAEGGVMLCLESVAGERWSELTFGMTEGWWRFSDTALRPAHPLLPIATWRSVLRDAGFSQFQAIGGEPGAGAARAQQALIVVRRPVLPRRWVLVGDGAGLAPELAGRLRQRGDHVTLRDVDAAVAGFDGANLIYLAALTLGADASAQACEALACAAPIRWLARFGRDVSNSQQSARAWLVTACAQAATGKAAQGPLRPGGRFQAPVWGVGRVFALEQPERWGGLIDLPPDADVKQRAEALIAVLAGSGDEDQIAWRGGAMLVPRLERATPPMLRRPRLHADATYLVTGGFGGLGPQVALWLARHGARHIALLGRRPDMTSDAVRDIQHAGAQVIPLAGDVADLDQMRVLLDGLAGSAPKLRGIVHAATAVSSAPIADLSPDQIAAMLRPKIAGLLVLEQLTSSLDFTVLFSSTASLTGGVGMAHYAAANAFLDASGQQAGGPVLSVNWGTWDIIRGASAADRAALRNGGRNPLNTAEALDAMGAMIVAGVRQMAVADIDWSRLKPLYERARPRPMLAAFGLPPVPSHATAAGGEPPAPVTPRADAPMLVAIAQLPEHARQEALESFVREAVARTLGLADAAAVPPLAGLFDLGMDSLMAVALHRTLELGVGRALPSTLTFNYPNAAALARYLAGVIEPVDMVADVMAKTDIDALSDEEVERRLRRHLESVG